AVVTSKAIAEEFNNGMEYFNSFGGNPVSCAVGHAVLNVIEDEGLRQNAKDVGKYLKSLLNELKEKHSLIGDVRGYGLFLGVELVRNLESLDPADKETDQIVNAMKEKRILISSDGPDHNIIKIKPPLVFNRENALFFTETLDEILS
ncbi:MAG: aminotransferase class III-fold pyridoxal phosphate-dependent enzyme, partial [Candidatus Marinimicrobia bacterium]|nr:aminotransferase class III-fold pyridoxal phosphate-dependent enzyme [Candidatus Neomarinimicrobiota bacterium]